MGLFGKLFGKKKEEEKHSTEPSIKPSIKPKASAPISPGTCGNCNRKAFSTMEFEAECTKAGFIKDAATGKFKQRVGGFKANSLYEAESRLQAQEGPKQQVYDQIEGQRGYRCKGCGAVYCMDCLYAIAPAHPSGGKMCPKCGSKFERYE